MIVTPVRPAHQISLPVLVSVVVSVCSRTLDHPLRHDAKYECAETSVNKGLVRLVAIWCNVEQNCLNRTQNPPTLAVMGVRPPLPAPELNQHKINSLQNAEIVCAQICAHNVPNFPLIGIRFA